ncbi:MAG: glycogen/starch/alpha-glucan phosphorylase [Acidobacteria bacterium]|nr:glycogen/starch/alpha-glucan phosphorylase [Acidobacteriota bacterium]
MPGGPFSPSRRGPRRTALCSSGIWGQHWAQFASRPEVRRQVVFLDDYDMRLANELGEGVDVWINTPRRPWEASGTSGMKVPVNGGLNLSTLDGWWAEASQAGHGWALGDAFDQQGATRTTPCSCSRHRSLHGCTDSVHSNVVCEHWIAPLSDATPLATLTCPRATGSPPPTLRPRGDRLPVPD